PRRDPPRATSRGRRRWTRAARAPSPGSAATGARAGRRGPAFRARGRTRAPDRSGPELEALDLAGRRLGQLADELDPARVLVGRDLVLHERLELAGQRVPGLPRLLEDDEGLGLDEPVGVLLADHRRFEHRGVAHERGLHLDRRDPDAPDLQHVVGATAEPEVTVLVLEVLVAGLDPGTEERLLRLLVLVPVVGHDRVALDAQVPDLAGGHRPPLVVHDDRLVAGHGQARRARPRRTGAVRDEDVEDLRRADAVDELDAEALAPARVELVGQRLARRDAEAERGGV